MPDSPNWNFFTNHAHVLFVLDQNPKYPLREVALIVGITERAVQRIVADLEDAGYLSRERDGRLNRYILHTGKELRHSIESHCTIGDLLETVRPNEKDADSDTYSGLDNWTVGEHGSEV